MNIIVVSGCTKGIGRAICAQFARCGFHIAGCARSVESIESMRNEFVTQFPDQKFFFDVCDMSEPAEVKAFAARAKAVFPRVSVVVNNVGLFIPGRIQEEEDGLIERLLRTNVVSAYHLTRAFLPEMVNNKHGHIFNICSMASTRAYDNAASYCISKFALLGFSKQLKEEMKGYGVRVTAVLPGATLTDSWLGTAIPKHRFMFPEDIAQTIWNIHELPSRADVEEIVINPQLGPN